MDSFWVFVAVVAGVGVAAWLFRPRGDLAGAMIAGGKAERVRRGAAPIESADGMTELEATATRMRIDFALFENEEDAPVVEDSVTLTDRSEARTFNAKTGDTSREYVFTYQFGRPVCSISITSPTWNGSIATGIHESSEVEEIALGEWATLLFKCTPLP